MNTSRIVLFVFAIAMAVLIVRADDEVHECDQRCVRTYFPVCAYTLEGTYREFPSHCFYEIHKCKHPKEFAYTVDGPCE